MTMELRSEGLDALRNGEVKPRLNIFDALIAAGGIPAGAVIDATDGWDFLWFEEQEVTLSKSQDAKYLQHDFYNSALSRTFDEFEREVSTLSAGKLTQTCPVWFPSDGDDHSIMMDAHRYALGAAMVIAYDTEYQACGDHNEILSYQICAYEPQGEWCEFIVHVKNGDRLTLDEVIDATRLHLGIKPKRLKTTGVLIVSHFGAAEWSALKDREKLTGSLQLIRKVPVTLGWGKIKLRINNRELICKLRVMDTFLLAPDNAKSLRGLGKTVGIEKVELPTGAIENMKRLRKENRLLFEEYGISDSRITLAYLIHITDLVHREIQLEDLPLTVGGISTRAFVTSMSETDYLAAFGLKKEKKFRKTVISTGAMREWVDGMFRDGFCGGLNNAIPGRVLPSEGRVVFDIDFVSAYPTAAATVPIIVWKNVKQIGNTPKVSLFEGSNGALLAPLSLSYVRFRFPDGTARPCIPIQTGKFGLIYPLRGEGYVTTPELVQAREKGAELQILHCFALPEYRDADALAHALFAPFLAEMISRRRRFEKKTLPNLLYKLICNALYGKLAQGVKKRFIRSFDRRDQLPDSAVTCPAYASAITGLVRAALIDLQDAIEEAGGLVHSATTDGCMASFPGHPDTHQTLEDIPGLMDAIERKSAIKVMRAGLKNMGLPDVILELKAIGDSCEIWKTRGYAICHNNEVKHLAKAGHQLDLDGLRDVAEDPHIRTWTMRSLSSAQSIYDGSHEDLVSITRDKRANLDFDFKLIPTSEGSYRPPIDIDEFLDWRESSDHLRKAGMRATHDRVSLAVGGHSLHGDSRATIRRKMLRALLQNIADARPPRLSDRDIAGAMGFTATDAKNAKRRDFTPLPDTPEIRAMIEDELHCAGFQDIPVNLFLKSE